MNGREKNHWLVQIQSSKGEILERPFASYWRTDQEDSSSRVAEACAAEMTVFEGGPINPQTGERRVQYAGVSAVLQPKAAAA